MEATTSPFLWRQKSRWARKGLRLFDMQSNVICTYMHERSRATQCLYLFSVICNSSVCDVKQFILHLEPHGQ